MKTVNTSELTKSVIASRLTAVAKQSPVTVFALAFLLASCGDDSSKGTEPVNDSSSSSTVSDIVTDTFADLPVCVDKREGATAYVKDEKVAYICVDGDWTPDSEVQSSASVNKESSSSVALTSSSSDKDEATSSGSDKANSSSSVVNDSEGSSSSVDQEGSSDSVESSESKEPSEESSSSVYEPSSSALMDGWHWDIPKDYRFNPEVSYGTMTDSRDGQTYKTVQIGDQIWMAENLNYADSNATSILKDNTWCYDNKDENCAVAGRLYSWYAAVDTVSLDGIRNKIDCSATPCKLTPDRIRGICPSGWHLPIESEVETLIANVGDAQFEGKHLKSKTGWKNCVECTDLLGGNGTDDFGFSALPVGSRNTRGDYRYASEKAYFWLASVRDFYEARLVDLDFDGDDVKILEYEMKLGFSVRCLKD